MGPLILIAEDDADIRSLLRLYLGGGDAGTGSGRWEYCAGAGTGAHSDMAIPGCHDAGTQRL